MKQVALIALLMFSSLSSAQVLPPQAPPPLDRISFQIAAKQWVSTQTAQISVNINVTLNNADLVKARADIMSSLNKIASGEWHLVQFDRSQDNSGLEKLFVQAQVRVNQSSLTDIYQSAKSVSKPGAQYTISSVDFKPSLEEIQNVRVAIRKQLYQQVSAEMDNINKVYPKQDYTVSNVIITEGDAPPVAPTLLGDAGANMVAMAKTAAPVALNVSNELILTAYVEVASNRKMGN